MFLILSVHLNLILSVHLNHPGLCTHSDWSNEVPLEICRVVEHLRSLSRTLSGGNTSHLKVKINLENNRKCQDAKIYSFNSDGHSLRFD